MTTISSKDRSPVQGEPTEGFCRGRAPPVIPRPPRRQRVSLKARRHMLKVPPQFEAQNPNGITPRRLPYKKSPLEKPESYAERNMAPRIKDGYSGQIRTGH